MKILSYKLKSNGEFSLVKGPYEHKQHPAQQCGLDKYVDVLDHRTGRINRLKLYEGKTCLYFKKNGRQYLVDFNDYYLYIPYQIMKV